MQTQKLLAGLSITLVLVLSFGMWTSPVFAVLENNGPNGEYFHDTESGNLRFDLRPRALGAVVGELGSGGHRICALRGRLFGRRFARAGPL